MKKSIFLSELKVKSFITALDEQKGQTLAGGAIARRRQSGQCHYDTDAGGGVCEKSAFSDCALDTYADCKK